MRRNPLGSGPWFAAALFFVLVVPRLVLAQGNLMFDTKGVSDKPQSKLWHADGSWWAVLNNSTKLAIYKLESPNWIHKMDLQNAVLPVLKGGSNDVLWDGTNLFVAVWDATTSKIYKLSYNSGTQTFAILAGFPVSIAMRPGSETIVIDKDSTGRLWVTYEAEQKIYVTYSTTTDHKTWAATPFAVSTGTVETDDISTIVAFGGNKIGVAWSDQRTHQICFRVHSDGQPPTTWQAIETVRSGFGVVDDHLNMKADSQGRVYLVAKDWFDAVYVCRRNLDNSWTVTTGASGLDCGTRPIVQIDEASNKLYVFYTRWAQCVSTGTHNIEERVAYLDNLLFSLPAVVIAKPNIVMNEVQGTKQLLPEGSIAILCEGNGKAYWNGWGPVSGIGGTDPGGLFPPPPSPPPNFSGITVSETPTTHSLLWRFDDNTGTKATDSSGNGRDGTLASGFATPHWVPGLMGSGLFFDGDDYITVNNSGLVFTNESFTLESWVKIDLTNSPGEGVIWARGDSLHSNYMLTTKGDQAILSWSVNDTTDVSVKASATLRDAAWHHIAGVYDTALGEGRVYIDGKKLGAKLLPAPTYSDSWKVYMGGLWNGIKLDKNYSGMIDMPAISIGAKYSADFTPPLLYPTSTTNYVRVSWTPSTSVAGILGYKLSRSTNGKTAQSLTTSPTPNFWFADFNAADGFLEYGISAVDGLTQTGSEIYTIVGFESSPPAVPSAPQGLAFGLDTATTEGPAFWEMEEGSGVTTADGTNLGHVAQLGGPASGDAAEPTWTNSFSGKALRFDGTNDYAEIADAPDLQINTSFTVELWVRRTKLNVKQALVTKDAGASKRNYSIAMTSANKVEFTWSRTSGSLRTTTSTTVIADMEWHHIACVYDKAQAQNFIYVDGLLAGSGSASSTVYTGPEPVLLGTRSSAEWFQGEMDLVRISNGIRYVGPFTPPTYYRGGARRHVTRLSWSLPDFGLVKDYRLYRQQLPSGSNTLIGTITYPLQAFTDVNVTKSITYRYTVRARNSKGNEGPASTALDVLVPEPTDAGEGPPVPRGPRLRLDPNPFNPQSTVRFYVEHRGPVEILLFDARGRRVSTVLNGVVEAGQHQLPLLRSDAGTRLASGIYFLRMQADGRESRVKAVLVQ